MFAAHERRRHIGTHRTPFISFGIIADMPVIGDEAVVLGRLDYSETSQILVLFTRAHGKVRAIAKGVKRSTKTRFAVGVDLLDIGRVMLSSRQERGEALATLTEWKQTRSLSGLREKLVRIHGGQYAGEITAHLTEDWDPHAELFDALTATLAGLAEAEEALPAVVGYQWTLLDQIGSLPRFDACAACGRENELTHFSSFEGGLVCRHCEPGRVEKWEVGAATVALLREMDSYEWGMGNGEERIEDCQLPIADSRLAGEEAKRNENAARAEESAGRTERSIVGAFAVLNYHIAHLMGREPLLAASLVPRGKRRTV